MNSIAVACVAALGFLLFGLGLAVSGARKRFGQFDGFIADPTNPLYKLIRAHGNTAEYAPYLAVLMLYLGARNPANWVGWVMLAATAFRFLFVAGVLFFPTMSKPNVVRFVGAMGTYIAGGALCVAVLQTPMSAL